MDADDMASAIAYELGSDGRWKAQFDGLGEILFENEEGEKFLITVVKTDDDEEAA